MQYHSKQESAKCQELLEESNKYVSESQVIDLATEGGNIPINEIDNKTRWMKYEQVNAYYIKK